MYFHRHRPAVFIALLYLCSFTPIAAVVLKHPGFPLDDSWIHQVVARNLVWHHTLGFDPHHPSSGSTSLLWTGLLGVGQLLLPRSPVLYCLGVSSFFLFVVGFLFGEIAARDGLTGSKFWIVTLAPALSGNFLWFATTGMEHLLFLALSLGVITAWFSEVPAALTASLVFLTGITRPEGIFLPLILLAGSRRERHGRRDQLWVVSGSLLAALCTGLMNLITAGQLKPQTMQGRALLYVFESVRARRLNFLYAMSLRLLDVWRFLDPVKYRNGEHLLQLKCAAFVLLSVMAWGVLQLVRLKACRLLCLYAWAALIFLLYLAMLPNPGHGGRYQSLLVMLFLPALMFGFFDLARRVLGSRAATALVCLAGGVTLWSSLHLWRLATRDDLEQISSEHRAMANWVEEHVPERQIAAQQIAVFDIGQMGYMLGGNVVDLGGLVDRKYLPAVRAQATVQYLHDRQVEYVILPSGGPYEASAQAAWLFLTPEHGITLREVYHVCAETSIAHIALISSGTAAPCQQMYSVAYSN